MTSGYVLSGSNLITFNLATPGTATSVHPSVALLLAKHWSASISVRRTACSMVSPSTPPPISEPSIPFRLQPAQLLSSGQLQHSSISRLAVMALTSIRQSIEFE